LWPTEGKRASAPSRAAEAISEANRWLARIEAVLRRSGIAVIRPEPGVAKTAARASPPAPDLFEDEDAMEDEEDELPI